MSTHSPAEWAAFLSLGIGVHGAFSAPYFLFVNAKCSDFDPRPALSRLVESGRVDPVLCAVANALSWAREKTRQAALSAAVLLLLLTAPKGVTR
jgi:hypothetical protein